MFLKQPFNHGGRLYDAGENIRGKLPPDALQLLLDNDLLLDESETEEKEEANTGELQPGADSALPEDPGTPGEPEGKEADDQPSPDSAQPDEHSPEIPQRVGRKRPGEPR